MTEIPKLTARTGPGSRIVAMTTFREKLVVATERGVWMLVGDKFQEVEFVPSMVERRTPADIERMAKGGFAVFEPNPALTPTIGELEART